MPKLVGIKPGVDLGISQSQKEDESKIPFDLPWWTKAYNWFRKWGWVPLGFVLLLLGFIFGGALFRRRPDGKVITPFKDIKDKVDENNKQIDEEIEQARQAHVAEVQRIEREHAAELEKLDEDQERRRQELRRDPKKLSRWLTGLARGEQS